MSDIEVVGCIGLCCDVLEFTLTQEERDNLHRAIIAARTSQSNKKSKKISSTSNKGKDKFRLGRRRRRNWHWSKRKSSSKKKQTAVEGN